MRLPIQGVSRQTATKWLRELRWREEDRARPRWARIYLLELPDGKWCIATRMIDPNRGLPAFDVLLRGARGTLCCLSEIDLYQEVKHG